MLAGVLLAVGIQLSPKSQALMQQADALVARGDFEAASATADAADQPAAAEQIRGVVAEARDSPREAADHYAKALEWAERMGSSPLTVSAAEGLTRMYGQQGREDLTLALANRLLKTDPANRALYLFERGVAYSTLNEGPAARQAFDEALPLAEAAGNLKLMAQIHRHLGLWCWRYQRDFRRTIEEYEQALTYARRAKAWRMVVLTEITYGNPFRNKEVSRLSEALRHYDAGLIIARREHMHHEIAYLLKNMGDVYRQQGDLERAGSALTEAMQIAEKRGVYEIRWMTRNQLGMLIRDRDPVTAERYFREAVEIIESQQSDVLLEDFRPGALAASLRFANPYDQLIDLLSAQHRPEEAFFAAERERGRAFLETLSAGRAALARDVPKEFSAAERQILDRIKTAQALLRTDALSDAKRADLVASVGRHEAELRDLRLKLAVERPGVAHARYPKLWQTGELQSKLLASDESLLSFYLGADRSYAWVLTHDRLSTVTLPAEKEIERAVRAALEELRDPLAQNRTALAALSRVLSIDRIARLAAGPRLVLVPHGILYDVPFEALVDDRGRPLVERFAMSYAASASSLAFLRSGPQKASGPMTLLAVADPIVGGKEMASTRQVDLAHMNLLEPVPHSADEVQQIALLFGQSARVLERSHATLSELGRRLEETRILHFATHGLIDETRPERSGLVLTADPPRDDGLLQARDIYSLHLNADLVTLSACETALGQNVTGEGIIGLTRAFFYAGARSVVASLWDVEDMATARFMQRFYANIQRGQPIDIALQRAKLDFIHSGGTTSNPFYWASFVVSGNARASVDVPSGSSMVPLETASIAALLVAVAWIYRRMVKVRRGEEASRLP